MTYTMPNILSQGEIDALLGAVTRDESDMPDDVVYVDSKSDGFCPHFPLKFREEDYICLLDADPKRDIRVRRNALYRQDFSRE
ncbi:MAG: hypothetical protein KKB79_02575 [Nanoarchaeota archaeon]|nr:hypothetical protein [Nanoarchaeota archaeon]